MIAVAVGTLIINYEESKVLNEACTVESVMALVRHPIVDYFTVVCRYILVYVQHDAAARKSDRDTSFLRFRLSSLVLLRHVYSSLEIDICHRYRSDVTLSPNFFLSHDDTFISLFPSLSLLHFSLSLAHPCAQNEIANFPGLHSSLIFQQVPRFLPRRISITLELRSFH